MYCPSNYVRRLDFEPSLAHLVKFKFTIFCYYGLRAKQNYKPLQPGMRCGNQTYLFGLLCFTAAAVSLAIDMHCAIPLVKP